MGKRGRALAIVLPPALAWLLAVALHWLVPELQRPRAGDPTLPLVSLPFDPERDVVSSVRSLFVVLAAGFLLAALVEPSKCLVSKSLGAYLLMTTYQVVLAADVFRCYAPDWWAWFAAWIGFQPLTRATGWESLFVLHMPWPAGVLLVGILAYLYLALWRQRGSPVSAS